MKIRFCKQCKGAKKACRQLQQEYPQLDIKLKDCLKQCAVCRDMPMVTFDKQLCSASTWEELKANLLKQLKIQ